MARVSWIGLSVPRKDVIEKVTGSAVFGDDLRLPRQLCGRFYRSPIAHGRIVNIDTAKARSVPGVRAVVTGADLPYRFGPFIQDQTFLARDKVRYVGEPVVGVAAESPEAAEEALGLVKVDFEPLPPVFDPVAGAGPDAPLVHDDWGAYKILGLARPVPGTNICDHFTLRKGDIEAGWREADVVVEGEYYLPMIQHATIETHVATALMENNNYLTVWTPAQSPFYLRQELAGALGIPMSQIRIICTRVGGGFGSKHELRAEALAVALALQVKGRPVRVAFDRHEEFAGAVVRGPARVRVRTGAKRDGRLVAQKITAYWDTGAYSTYGPRVNYNAGFSAAGPYQIPNIWIDGYCVCTNKPIGSAYRGFGVPEIAWAHESLMDRLAQELGMDPLELRLRNALREGSPASTGETLFSVGVRPALEAVAREIGWTVPAKETPSAKVPGNGQKRRGRGLACFCKLTGTPSLSSVVIRLNEDGTVTVLQSGMELGQGLETVIAQIVAEEMGVSVDKVSLSPVDTAFTPYEKSTTSSRCTMHVGNAARFAIREIKEQLRVLAGEAWGVPAEAVEVEEGLIKEKGGAGRSIAMEALAASKILKDRPPVVGHGSYSTADIWDPPDPETRQSQRATVYWMYGAQAAEVEVDTETGEVRVLKIAAAHDVGRAINPANCQQQIEGAVMMGLGHVLWEEMLFDPEGRVRNANLVDYKVPTAMDSDISVSVTLVETNHPEGPFGAKGIGEPGLCPTAPAVGNAVFDAIGKQITDLPVTPEKILAALQGSPSCRR